MQKINKLDLNVNDLKEQASKIYDKLSDMDIDTQGIFEKIKTCGIIFYFCSIKWFI